MSYDKDKKMTIVKRKRGMKMTQLYKNILVGIDESPLSQKALHQAIQLAKQNQSTLYVVTVLNEEEVTKGTDEFVATEEFFKLERERAEKLLHEAKEAFTKEGVTGDCYLQFGSAKKLLAETLPQTWNIDLTVIGAPDKHLENYFGIGSVASYVVRHSKNNVFITK